MADKNAPIDPTAPFARRCTKHEWSEAIPASMLEASSPSSGGGGGTSSSSKAHHGSSSSTNSPSAANSMNPSPSYTPIKRNVVNACLASLYGDKRLLLMGGSVGGESTTQVAEFDVATKQWSHGMPMPQKRSEGTCAVVFVAPPPPSADAPPPQPTGKAPKNEAANAAVLAATSPQQLIVMFGGWDDSEVMGDTYFYLVPGGAAPPPASSSSGADNKGGGGGGDAQGGGNKTQGKWWRLGSGGQTKEAAAVPQPPARRGHAMASMVDSAGVQLPPPGAAPGSAASLSAFQNLRYSTSAFIFGGFDGKKRMADTWELSVPFACNTPASPTPATSVPADALAWKKLSVTGFQPTPRDGAALAADPAHRRLLLFGGFTTHRENDCYALEVETCVWTKLSLSPSPACRFGAFAAVSGLFALVGLGQDAKGPSGALFQLMLPPVVAGSDAHHAQPRWAICPVESPTGGPSNAADPTQVMVVSSSSSSAQQQQQQGGAGGDASASSSVLVPGVVEPRVDFSWTASPELGPLLALTQVPDKKERGGGGGGGDSARDGSGASQKRTLWIFGGSNDKMYHSSLLELEMDRPDQTGKGGRR